jgi:hypothetical protein
MWPVCSILESARSSALSTSSATAVDESSSSSASLPKPCAHDAEATERSVRRQRLRHRRVRASSGRSLSVSKTRISSCAKTLPCACSPAHASACAASVPALVPAGLTEDMRMRSGSRRPGLGQIGSKRSSSRARTEALKLSASLSLAPGWRDEQTRARARSQKDDTCCVRTHQFSRAQRHSRQAATPRQQTCQPLSPGCCQTPCCGPGGGVHKLAGRSMPASGGGRGVPAGAHCRVASGRDTSRVNTRGAAARHVRSARGTRRAAPALGRGRLLTGPRLQRGQPPTKALSAHSEHTALPSHDSPTAALSSTCRSCGRSSSIPTALAVATQAL